MIAQHDDWMQAPVTIFLGKTPDKIPIYIHGRSTPIGHVAGGLFKKTIRKNHFLTRPRAIAFDRSTLEDAEEAGALAVQVTDSDSGKIYSCAIADIWRRGFAVQRGYGAQIAMVMAHWRVNYEEPGPVWESNQAIKAAQPSLFGEG